MLLLRDKNAASHVNKLASGLCQGSISISWESFHTARGKWTWIALRSDVKLSSLELAS